MNYIAATDGGLYAFFHKNGGVQWCGFDGNDWLGAKMLVDDASRDFSVNLTGHGMVVVSRDSKGNIAKTIFDGKSPDVDINLIYSLPVVGETGYMLMSQFAQVDGGWGSVRRLDNVAPVGGVVFKPVSISGQHLLTAYHQSQLVRGFESRLGYREIYDKQIGDFTVVHSGMGQYVDYSFLATPHILHAAVATRGLFGSRLIYKYKAGGFSKEIVVAEGGHPIDNIVLYLLDDVLHLAFVMGGVLYSTYWTGDGFAAAAIHTGSYSKNMGKAVFLASNSDGNRFLAAELLVDKAKPWEIQLHKEFIVVPQSKMIKTGGSGRVLSVENSEEGYNNFFNDMEHELEKMGKD
ncbi:MAG: hypothetical protein FWC93_02485 [Defluviitaleaceae bacterium]|nr:hypothetical protein [Defluviitaleaceae bacterium]